MTKSKYRTRSCRGHCYVWTRVEAPWALDPGVYLATRCAHCGWVSKLITKYKAEHDTLVSGSSQGYRNVHESRPCPALSRKAYAGVDDDEF